MDPQAVSGLALAPLSHQSCLLGDQSRDTPCIPPTAVWLQALKQPL